MEKEKRTRRWCFTLNNPTMTKEDLLKDLTNKYQIRYIIIGKEIAPSTNTIHFQGFVDFENPTTFNQMKERLSGAHLEPTSGTNKQNRDYCSKENDFVEMGTLINRANSLDLSHEIITIMYSESTHPSEIAFAYPDYSSYIIKHYKELVLMYNERSKIQFEKNVEKSIDTILKS